ncbi:MAG: class I SAM-dependent methyltransferase [Halobacteriota archaeon]
MHEQKEEGKKPEMMVLWEKLGDSEKKVLMMRKLEGKIMKKEHMIKQLQYKVETLKTIKSWLEKDANFFEAVYQGEPPWDIGRPQKEYIQLEQGGEIVGSVLDAGCGTGENALYLAAQKHEVWGIDFTPIAIQKAEEKAAQRNLHVTFLVLNALELHTLGRTFDTVIDSGLFHVLSDEDRPIFVDNLAAVIHRGGTYFMLCFSELEPGSYGPRRITQAEIRDSFRDGWHINYIRPATIEHRVRSEGARAWLSSISKE